MIPEFNKASDNSNQPKQYDKDIYFKEEAQIEKNYFKQKISGEDILFDDYYKDLDKEIF